MVDLARLREIVRGGSTPPVRRELTYEPVTGYERGPEPGRVGDVLGGAPIDTDVGPCLVIDRRYEGDRWHGEVKIADCRVEDGETLALLDPRLPHAGSAAPEASRIVFVDLETTGLSGGAGTVAFLVGCGYFDLDAFQVRQFLLTSFSGERALLAAVADFIGPAALIVTFNGKTFDFPVMETRWLFHRMETPFADKRHFDMLHPARRLWRGRDGREDGGCSLGELERSLIGFARMGDVPGFEIPGRYFQFLRSGDPRPLEAVLEHNRLDLVSLAAVVALATRLVEGGVEACRDPAEALAVGKVLERAGRLDRALAYYRRAAKGPSARVRADAWHRLALALRRARRFEEAAEAWTALLATSGRARTPAGVRRQALEALAIHHEHRAADLVTARRFALEALDADMRARWEREVRHRLDRLERKMRARADRRPPLLETENDG